MTANRSIVYFGATTPPVVFRCQHCRATDLFVEGVVATGCALLPGTMDVWLELVCRECARHSSLSIASCGGAVWLDWESRVKARARQQRDRENGTEGP